ncbi:MAG: hypothetical protein ACREDI_02205 [Roseiarcus sp.]
MRSEFKEPSLIDPWNDPLTGIITARYGLRREIVMNILRRVAARRVRSEGEPPSNAVFAP